MFSRSLRVAFVLGAVALVLAPACGGSSSDPRGGGGAGGKASNGGGAGKAPIPQTLACGTKTCKDVVLTQLQNFLLPACCADEAASQCGIDSSVLAMFGPTFPVACQQLAQPGVLDKACPGSTETPVAGTPFTISFPGCCRASGVCGYQLDTIGGLVPLGLGCVDSGPFLDGGTPSACGGAIAAGGAGGDAGSGSGGAAGTVEPGAAGMAGESAAGANGG